MTIWSSTRRYGVALAALALVSAACGSDASVAAASGDRPTVVVTTNILGDVVGELIGDQAEVITIMPVGADPHDFQPSAQEVDQMQKADALIVNGADFEEGLLDVIDSARDAGVPTHEATDEVETIELGSAGQGHGDEQEHAGEEHADDKHGEEEHSDEEQSDDDQHADEEHADEQRGDQDEHGHDHEGVDPHFFTDPARMVDAVEGIATFLSAEIVGIDTDALDAAVAGYVAELEALDAEVVRLVDEIPEQRRVLVTNHEVFGYFADRYGFEVVGAVIPSGTTAEGASAGELAELAELVAAKDLPALFADTSSSSELAEILAAEVGDIEVVELYSESLGESGSDGATYLSMVRTNASRINEALA